MPNITLLYCCCYARRVARAHQGTRSLLSQIQGLQVPRICSPSVKKMGANLLAIVANRQRALEGMVSSRKHRSSSAAPSLTSICMPGLLLVCPTARGPQAQAPGLDRANVRPCHDPPPPRPESLVQSLCLNFLDRVSET